MADKLVEFLQMITTNGNILVLLLSAFPLIELKGAIPVGLKAGISVWQSGALGYLGSTLVSIPLFFLLIPVFNLLKKIGFIKKLILKLEGVFHNKAKKLAQKAYLKNGGKYNGEEIDKKARLVLIKALLIFVAVPFPITGVWTGTAIAVFLGLKFKEFLPAIAIGNFIAGSIITLLTAFFSEYVDIIIYILLAIAIVMLVILIIKIALTPAENESRKNEKDGL